MLLFSLGGNPIILWIFCGYPKYFGLSVDIQDNLDFPGKPKIFLGFSWMSKIIQILPENPKYSWVSHGYPKIICIFSGYPKYHGFWKIAIL